MRSKFRMLTIMVTTIVMIFMFAGCGNSAKSVWWLVPTNYTRECLAVIKDFVVGNFRNK